MLDPIAQKIFDRHKQKLASKKAKKNSRLDNPTEEIQDLPEIYKATDPTQMGSDTVSADVD